MSNGDIEKIKSNLSISEIISDYIKIDKAGSSYKARCPFHNEKTPSFYISPDKGIYKCFGCGKSGDIFSFVEEYEGIEFKDALKKLASRAGVVLSNKKEKREDIEKNKIKKKLEDIHLHTTFFWQRELYENKEAIKYLKKRGIEKQTMIDFKLGYAPNEWNKTHNFLKGKGFSDQDILLAGIIKKNEKGKIYDRFRDRLIFPIFESMGKVVAYSGRDLSGSENTAKYLNSPSTILFDKSKELYGFNFAKNNIRKQNYIIITEGQFDIVLSQQNNFKNTVATSGTSLTEKHLDQIKKFSTNIIFAFDSDKAGISSAFRGTKLAISKGFTVKIANIPQKEDPADILSKENGRKKWAKIISTSEDFLIFFSERIIKSNKKFEEKVKQMEDEILPLIAEIKDSIIAEKYLRNIADGFGVSEKTIISAMQKNFDNDKKYNKNIIKKNEKENSLVSSHGEFDYTEYPEESLDSQNYYDEDQNFLNLMEKNKNIDENNEKNNIKLENKNNFNIIILNNKKSKILQRIAKIYFLQKSLKTDKSEEEIKYIKERYLKFLPEEKFEDFERKYSNEFKVNNFDFESILIDDNLIKVEIDQLFDYFEKINLKEKIRELQKELLKYNFLNDKDKISDIKENIAKLIKDIN